MESTYDSDGNVIMTADREHFHNDTNTGALGNPSTTPYARVSYATSYFGLANRVTATVNIGTNGGSAYTRPLSTLPKCLPL